MDINKIKEFAVSTSEKAKDGIIKANEMRKRASQESKIVLPPTINLGFNTPTAIRKTVEGDYYIGFYSKKPDLFKFVDFQFDGSRIIEKTVTKGKTTQKGRSGSTIIGGLIGATINPTAAVLGGLAGANRGKKGTINSTSTTITEEIPGKAQLTLRNLKTNDIKIIKIKLTQAQANNIQNFFSK
ncbi:TPA: hypothetical protein VA428_001062 [Streptococcus agalactiae]|nr:hypothetical protein [Streptococcus agalactiae]